MEVLVKLLVLLYLMAGGFLDDVPMQEADQGPR
jgi:hypothetical protein